MPSLFAQSELFDLIEKVEKGERLDYDAGVRMMNSQDILALGYMANIVRERKNGNQTYFMVSELVQLKLNIETSVGESTPTEAEYGVPLPLVEVGVSRLDRHFNYTDVHDATMLYGNMASAEERIDHLLQLRALQDETGEFLSFTPLSDDPKDALPDETMGVGTTTGIEDLKVLAISRILLDNFDHIKVFCIMLGLKLTQVSLAFGVDDLDGNVVTKQAMIHMIQKAGRDAVERYG